MHENAIISTINHYTTDEESMYLAVDVARLYAACTFDWGGAMRKDSRRGANPVRRRMAL